jgi:hypothetical protein
MMNKRWMLALAAVILISVMTGIVLAQTIFSVNVTGTVTVSGAVVNVVSVSFAGTACPIQTAGGQVVNSPCGFFTATVGSALPLTVKLQNPTSTPVPISVSTTTNNPAVLNVSPTGTNPLVINGTSTAEYSFNVECVGSGGSGFTVAISSPSAFVPYP